MGVSIGDGMAGAGGVQAANVGTARTLRVVPLMIASGSLRVTLCASLAWPMIDGGLPCPGRPEIEQSSYTFHSHRQLVA